MFSGTEYARTFDDLIDDRDRMSEDEEEEEAGEAKMDLAEEEEEEEVVCEWEFETFPEPAPKIKTIGHDQFVFDKKSIPPGISFVPPHVLNAMNWHKELSGTFKSAIVNHPCFPIPVHSSPLVSLLGGGGTAVKTKYVSFLYTCHQLHVLKAACVNGLFTFHKSITPQKLADEKANYAAFITRLENEQNRLIDQCLQLRDRASFVQIMEQYALDYIHTLEYFLYVMLVEPFEMLQFEHVMTPNETPEVEACSTNDTVRFNIISDAFTFFRYKQEMRDEQEKKNRQDGVENTDKPSMQRLTFNSQKEVLNYKGYMSDTMIWEYFCFLDVDGLLMNQA
jgi:hypothetical protein